MKAQTKLKLALAGLTLAHALVNVPQIKGGSMCPNGSYKIHEGHFHRFDCNTVFKCNSTPEQRTMALWQTYDTCNGQVTHYNQFFVCSCCEPNNCLLPPVAG